MNKNILTNIIVGVVVGVIAFVGGMHYNSAKRQTVAQGQFGGNRTAGNFAGRTTGAPGTMRGGAVIGSVLSKDDKSMTVSTQGGGSKIVFLAPSTTVSKSATGTLADVATGSDVVVMGTTNADGSVTAQSIQLRPKQ